MNLPASVRVDGKPCVPFHVGQYVEITLLLSRKNVMEEEDAVWIVGVNWGGTVMETEQHTAILSVEMESRLEMNNVKLGEMDVVMTVSVRQDGTRHLAKRMRVTLTAIQSVEMV